MLILKSIGKVLEEVLGGLLLVCSVIAATLVVAVVCVSALSGINWLIGAIFGSGWAAFKTWLSGAAIYLVGGVTVLGIIALFVIEVSGEYAKLKAEKEGRI